MNHQITLGAINSYALSLMVKSMQTHISGYIHLALYSFLLVRCPKGSYYDSLQENCIRCSAGSYQSQEGRFECLPCPDGTWTIGNDTGNFTSCQGTNFPYLCLLLQKQFFVVKFPSPISSPLILIMIPFPRKDRLSFFVTIVSTSSFSSLTERN